MSDQVTAIRQRYEATPRELDDDLMRMARGDRGCQGDAIAGGSGLLMAISGVLATFGLVGWGFVIAGAMGMIVGFMLSAAAQAKSAPIRRKALTQGPLVLGRVVHADPALYEPGDAVMPARVVYTPDPARRFDARLLHGLGQKLQALRAADATPPDQVLTAAVLRDANRVETVRLPSSLAGEVEAYLSVVTVDPRRLPGRRIDGGEVTLIVDPSSGFAEHV